MAQKVYQLAANDKVATLDENDLVKAEQLPSYVDDVLEFDSLASFPDVSKAEDGKIYIARDTNLAYRLGNGIYVPISGHVAIDSALDAESENPVQNKTVTAELAKRASTDELSLKRDKTDLVYQFPAPFGIEKWTGTFGSSAVTLTWNSDEARWTDEGVTIIIRYVSGTTFTLSTMSGDHQFTGMSVDYTYTDEFGYRVNLTAVVSTDTIALKSDIVTPTIDDNLSFTSTNPVQNKVVAQGIQNVVSSIEIHEADTSNPHKVTAAQVGALPLTGGTVTGAVDVQGADLAVSAGGVFRVKKPDGTSGGFLASVNARGGTEVLITGGEGDNGYLTVTTGGTGTGGLIKVTGGGSGAGVEICGGNGGDGAYVKLDGKNVATEDAVDAKVSTIIATKADLVDGMVPSSQLPSYVDDVLEYDSKTSFPETGETGKIYVAKDTNLTYRWSGTDYVEISPSIALGETASTAYPGDKGKAAAEKAAEAYDAADSLTSAVNSLAGTLGTHTRSTSNPHSVTAEQVGALPTTGGTLTGGLTVGAESNVGRVQVIGADGVAGVVLNGGRDDAFMTGGTVTAVGHGYGGGGRIVAEGGKYGGGEIVARASAEQIGATIRIEGMKNCGDAEISGGHEGTAPTFTLTDNTSDTSNPVKAEVTIGDTKVRESINSLSASVSAKANKATTLSGYGITDAVKASDLTTTLGSYVKTDTKVNGKPLTGDITLTQRDVGILKSGSNNIDIGEGADGTGGTDSISIGSASAATGTNSIAIGYGAVATDYSSIALGETVVSHGDNTFSVNASGLDKVYLGENTLKDLINTDFVSYETLDTYTPPTIAKAVDGTKYAIDADRTVQTTKTVVGEKSCSIVSAQFSATLPKYSDTMFHGSPSGVGPIAVYYADGKWQWGAVPDPTDMGGAVVLGTDETSAADATSLSFSDGTTATITAQITTSTVSATLATKEEVVDGYYGKAETEILVLTRAPATKPAEAITSLADGTVAVADASEGTTAAEDGTAVVTVGFEAVTGELLRFCELLVTNVESDGAVSLSLPSGTYQFSDGADTVSKGNNHFCFAEYARNCWIVTKTVVAEASA